MSVRTRQGAGRSVLGVLIAGCAAIPGAERAAASEDGARLVTICASCHRLDGRNTGISSLLRWEPEEIVDKLHDFQSNARANNAMRAVSLSLSDDEIVAVANEFAMLAKKAKSP